MDAEKVLLESGLSEGEAEVYLALLKLGSVPVSKIKEETNLHRTTIYDFLDKLLNKGLVNYVVKNNIKFYKATHPNKLLDYVKEKEENIKEILPKLKELAEFDRGELKVEVYKGREGFKTVLNDQLRFGGELLAFGVDESKFKERFPILLEQYFKKEEEKGMRERLLASEEAEFIYKKKTTNYRFISKEFFNPTPSIVYGNNVGFIIWEPFNVIIIENAELADSFRKYFEMLWRIAKKSRKLKR